MPFGCELRSGGGARFRLWAPAARAVAVRLDDGDGAAQDFPATPTVAGWFELERGDTRAGDRYSFVIDGRQAVPDPASRWNPDDIHGASVVVDPLAFDWQDADWKGRPWHEVVLYELHIGTFTPEGTFAGVERRLDHLVDLGVTAVELMPVADFPGRRDWGYDGALLFAPDAAYGTPDDLKRLVQAAHARGLMVFLDVVYNHFGPEGNYLHLYAPQFFTERHHTPWGVAIDFQGPHSGAVRDFCVHNALYWLEEFHFDGLRLDAVHAIYDTAQRDILAEIAEAVRARLGADRHVHLVLENDDNCARHLCRRPASGACYEAQWNDDIHHALHVLATGETDGYYADYADAPARHLARCLAEGFAYQGEPSRYRGATTRGEPSVQLPPQAFVSFLQNHDQVGNRAFGERLPASRTRQRVAHRAGVICWRRPSAALHGRGVAATTPFQFFCDFGGELRQAVTAGRRASSPASRVSPTPQRRRRSPTPTSPQLLPLRSSTGIRSVIPNAATGWPITGNCCGCAGNRRAAAARHGRSRRRVRDVRRRRAAGELAPRRRLDAAAAGEPVRQAGRCRRPARKNAVRLVDGCRGGRAGAMVGAVDAGGIAMSTLLDQLCERCGVRPGYHDIWDEFHRTPDVDPARASARSHGAAGEQ